MSRNTLSGITEREASAWFPVELFEGLDVPVVVAALDGTIREATPCAADLYEQAALAPWIVERVLEHGGWQGRVELTSGTFEVRATPHGEPAAEELE